ADALPVGQVEVHLVLGEDAVQEPQHVVAAADADAVHQVEIDEGADLVQLAELDVAAVAREAGLAVPALQRHVHVVEVGAPRPLPPGPPGRATSAGSAATRRRAAGRPAGCGCAPRTRPPAPGSAPRR